MKLRFFPFLFATCALLAACTAPAAAPTTIPASVAPAPTAQAVQPTTLPTAVPPPQVPTAVPTAIAVPTAVIETSLIPTLVVPRFDRTLALKQPPLAGDDVRALQIRLLELGYKQLGQADGIFGPNTETAVRAFQTLNQLEIDGVVGQNTWSILYEPEPVGYDLHPIVDTERRLFLGVANNGAWIAPEIAASLIGETIYQLLSQTGPAERANAAAPAPPDGPPCEDTRFVEFKTPPPADRPIALAADWNPLPYPVTEIPTDTAMLQAPVATALQVLGIAKPNVRISRALQADLNGDSKQETIVAATYRTGGLDFPQPSAKAGDYSAVFVLPGNTNVASVIASDVITTDVEFGAPLEFRLLGLWDLNGDGTLEVAIAADYYEGESTSIFTLNGTAAKQVLVAGCGV